jgi:hypothetical protein
MLLWISFLYLAGCAGMDGVAPSELSKPERITSFNLTSDAIGELTSANAFGSRTKYSGGLIKGSYVSVVSDEYGTYYQGPKGCVSNSASPFKNLDGGIWIPKTNSSDEPRFWYYLRRIELPDNFRRGIVEVLLNEIHIGNVKRDLSTKIEPFLLDQIHIQAD